MFLQRKNVCVWSILKYSDNKRTNPNIWVGTRMFIFVVNTHASIKIWNISQLSKILSKQILILHLLRFWSSYQFTRKIIINVINSLCISSHFIIFLSAIVKNKRKHKWISYLYVTDIISTSSMCVQANDRKISEIQIIKIALVACMNILTFKLRAEW